MGEHTGFACPRCRRVSHNPHELAYGWCDACKAFTAAPREFPAGGAAAVGGVGWPPAPVCYDLDHRPVDPERAEALLADFDARLVARHTLPTAAGEITVSTVFTVYPWNAAEPGPPELYHTAVFAEDGEDLRRERSCTRAGALAAHDRALACARDVAAARAAADGGAG